MAKTKPLVQVENAKELRRTVKRIADADLKKELREANKAGAEIVAQESKVLVPSRSGKLRGSIKATAGQASASVKAGSAKTVPYAGPIHFGWPTRPDRARGWRGGPIAPQPFIYEAADRRIKQVREAYDKRVNALAKKLESK